MVPCHALAGFTRAASPADHSRLSPPGQDEARPIQERYTRLAPRSCIPSPHLLRRPRMSVAVQRRLQGFSDYAAWDQRQ